MQAVVDMNAILDRAADGVSAFLDKALSAGRIDAQLHSDARAAVVPNLTKWLKSDDVDRISPNAKSGIMDAVESGNWEAIVNAFRRDLSFGTGGIRGMMAFDKQSIQRLRDEGIDAPILKGPNTINNLVLLRVSLGVARFGKDKGFSKIVIGYDTRTQGRAFAHAIAELFLAFDYQVFLFDNACPYPEVTYAIPSSQIKADIGILISASHNDYRYNGYKLSSSNGSQFDPEQRDEMYRQYIVNAEFSDVKSCKLCDAPNGKLVWLGGSEKLAEHNYLGHGLLNIHQQHQDHIISQLVDATRVRQQNQTETNPLQVGFCPFYGAGLEAVPRLLSSVGFEEVRTITHEGINKPNGLFPAFRSDPGKEQQPDPGDARAAEIAVNAFKAQFGNAVWEKTDILLGTDPDADRCGVVVKVPENQRSLYDGRDYVLLPADDVWALILWFRLQNEAEQNGGSVPDATKKFIVQSLPTSDSIVRIARKFGLGAMKTWVGFANLAAGTRMMWEGQELPPNLFEGRANPTDAFCHPFVYETEGMDGPDCKFNYAAMEQSNGFSILGGSPPDNRSLGTNGHVRDKDGTFAAILVAEIAAYAKSRGTTLFEMADQHLYLDPVVGLFVNLYEPDPLDGEFPGIAGDRKKKSILRRALGLFQFAKAGGLSIGGREVLDAVIYRTGKYDHVYPPTWDFEFPDEGIRFYFDQKRLDWLLVRPSGTGNSLRLHVQLHSDVNRNNLLEHKAHLRTAGAKIVDDIREKLDAPRDG